MKPNKIILIRHGESEGNVDKKIYFHKPDYALNLTETGRRQAQETGRALFKILQSPAISYVSPFFRTRETFDNANLFLDSKTVRIDPRLREQEWGHLRTGDDYNGIENERDKYGTFYYRFPDGESCADVFDRISDFLNTLHRDFEKPDYPENCIIVTHGMTIRLFLMRWFHETVEKFESWRNPKNGEFFILEKQSNGKYLLLNEPRTYAKLKHSYQYEQKELAKII